MLADDTKMYKVIKINEDIEILGNHCKNLQKWCSEWLMYLNISKCKLLSITRNSNLALESTYSMLDYSDIDTPLERVSCIKDLGVLFEDNLSFD